MWNLAPQSHVVSCCSTSYDGTARSVPGLGPNVAHNHRRGPGPLCRMYVAEKQRCRTVLAKAAPKTPSWLDKALSRGYMDVKELNGVRVVVDEKTKREVDEELSREGLTDEERMKIRAKLRPQAEYLVVWADGSEPTWEPAANLSKDLLREFESKWWSVCRKGNKEQLEKLLSTGRTVLANTRDENGRAALHFTAGIGSIPCTELLLSNGASVDIQDKEGYTPLHMAAGYLNVDMVGLLLSFGADPEQPDGKGRSPLELIDELRKQLEAANNPAFLSRRMALEEVARVLTENTYEEVEPAAVIEARTKEDGTREFLMRWADGEEDSWVAEKHVSVEVMNDFDQGLEYAEAEEVLEERTDAEGSRELLVRWKDTREEEWVPEMYVSEDLVVMWDARKQGKDPMAEWKQWKKDQMEQQRLDSERAQAEARASAMNLQQMAQVQRMAGGQGMPVGAGVGSAPTGQSAVEAELGKL